MTIFVCVCCCGCARSLPACGLIDSDVTNFDLTLPDKSVQRRRQRLAGRSSSRPMSLLRPSCCERADRVHVRGDAGVPDELHRATCSATTQRASSRSMSALYQPIDLVTEKPELKSINDEPVIKVTIDSVTYEVTANTLNVATPADEGLRRADVGHGSEAIRWPSRSARSRRCPPARHVDAAADRVHRRRQGRARST